MWMTQRWLMFELRYASSMDAASRRTWIELNALSLRATVEPHTGWMRTGQALRRLSSAQAVWQRPFAHLGKRLRPTLPPLPHRC